MKSKKEDWTYLSCSRCGKEERVSIDKNYNKTLPKGWIRNPDTEIHNCYCDDCKLYTAKRVKVDEGKMKRIIHAYCACIPKPTNCMIGGLQCAKYYPALRKCEAIVKAIEER